jgi:hypothetical protein
VVNGKIVADAPPDWPEGTDVRILPAEPPEEVGVYEEDWPETPEQIEEWIARMDAIEPLILTAEDEARWEEAQREQKELARAKWDENAEKARRLFD